MIKLASLALFALVCSVPVGQAAAPSKAVFKGNYGGYANLKTATGENFYYSPLRFDVTKTGLITGTALRDKVLYTVTGKITKVIVRNKLTYVAKSSGTFSDGTKWNAKVSAFKVSPIKLIMGKGALGAYTGTLSLSTQ